MGEYFLDPQNTATYEGHGLMNWRVHWQMDEKTDISLRLKNLLNEDYAERADYAFSDYRYFVGEPRSLFIALSYRL